MERTVFLILCSLLLINADGAYDFAQNKVSYVISDTHYPPPPPVDDVARMARYVVHYSEWCVLSHISHQKNITGLPMGRVYSMSDGPIAISSGVPYIYTSFFDPVPRDLKIDNRCSMTMSLAQGDYCAGSKLDPEDPRCAQVILIGKFIFLQNDTKEWNFAEKALFSRHPAMKTWPASHHFTFGKLDIKNIIVVDNFGGSKHPSVRDYFDAKPIQGIVKSIVVEMV